MEDNGDVRGAWTPDFYTRYLPMVQPRQKRLSAFGNHFSDQSTAPDFIAYWTNNGQKAAQRPDGSAAIYP